MTVCWVASSYSETPQYNYRRLTCYFSLLLYSLQVRTHPSHTPPHTTHLLGKGKGKAGMQKNSKFQNSKFRQHIGHWCHRSSVIGHRSSVIGHRSSVISHRSSVIGRRSSVIGHRSSVIGHRSAIDHQFTNYSRIFLENVWIFRSEELKNEKWSAPRQMTSSLELLTPTSASCSDHLSAFLWTSSSIQLGSTLS